MTHDELLAKINDLIKIYEAVVGDSFYLKALRAVVELHKPNNYILHGSEITESWCTCGRGALTPYPCPTIQAIEKELK